MSTDISSTKSVLLYIGLVTIQTVWQVEFRSTFQVHACACAFTFFPVLHGIVKLKLVQHVSSGYFIHLIKHCKLDAREMQEKCKEISKFIDSHISPSLINPISFPNTAKDSIYCHLKFANESFQVFEQEKLEMMKDSKTFPKTKKPCPWILSTLSTDVTG